MAALFFSSSFSGVLHVNTVDKCYSHYLQKHLDHSLQLIQLFMNKGVLRAAHIIHMVFKDRNLFYCNFVFVLKYFTKTTITSLRSDFVMSQLYSSSPSDFFCVTQWPNAGALPITGDSPSTSTITTSRCNTTKPFNIDYDYNRNPKHSRSPLV